METVIVCPLGCECEEAKDGKLYRCGWYQKLKGKDPQSEQEFDEWRCAIQWANMLAIEHSQFERQTGAAVESFRNVVVKQNQQLFSLAKNQKLGAIPHETIVVNEGKEGDQIGAETPS